MTIGTGTFPQGAKFGFPRSYVYKIAFAGILDMPIQIGRKFEFHPSVVPTDTYFVILKLEWFVWNTNVYSLDFILDEAYYISSPDPTHRPVNYDLLYVPPTTVQPPALRFKPFGYTDTPNYFDLPPQIDPYWLPPPFA